MLVFAAVLAVMPLLSSADHGLEEHEYCSRHQAFEHVSTTASAGPTAPVGHAEAAPGGELPDHTFCPFVGVAGDELQPPACVGVRAAPRRVVSVAPVPLASQRRAAERAILSAAPKQSPPSHLV